MPSEMAIDMRHTKLKREEAALLAGELMKPSWESKNEGIHERVSFEDAIWGFDLAGGSYYHTPLRVVGVKPGSRAEKAGIRPGDKLKRINDIDTSTLTIQEAHKIIIDSGVHLKIAVTAPEDEEDAYFCYQDPIEDPYDSDEERRKEEERVKKRQVHAKVSSYWSLQWPWVSKRRIIYRESNCFMVPSKFEDNHRDRFAKQPMIRTQDDIVLQNTKDQNDLEKTAKDKQMEKENPVLNGINEAVEMNKKPVAIENEPNNVSKNENSMVNGHDENESMEVNGDADDTTEVEEDSTQEDVTESVTEVTSTEEVSNEDQIINEVLEETSADESNKVEEDKILNSILSDSDDQILSNSNDVDER